MFSIATALERPLCPRRLGAAQGASGGGFVGPLIFFGAAIVVGLLWYRANP